ncbi:c-type cytochrome [Paraferrimonas sedimenticola]|uniref:Cytochrome c n=1 Tax=Paraferrimonas sedimenticola TaxID=375674 RepID=A0AA37W0I2_9GAMM|nr:c-type cytochrome [Paraferrimonas sedimenticola]GLP95413.1 cytochrome c [Paraferrimonas sedimenticola]
MKKLALTLSVIAAMSAPAMAADDAKIVGNAEAGKAAAALCMACHGPDGNSPIDMYPKIAGQHEAYLNKQLTEFRLAGKTGGAQGRMDPVMLGMAMPLTDQQIADLSAFYASQTGSENPAAKADEHGKQLYTGGDVNRGITACIACHGPNGEGVELAGFPAVAGQHVAYTKGQLEKFRDGQRNNDLNGMMQDTAKKLSDEDILALSNYIGSLK